MEKRIIDEVEVMVGCGDWVEVEYEYGDKVRGWLEYGFSEDGSLIEFQKVEVARILGGEFVKGVVIRDMDRGLKEVKIPVLDIIDIVKMDDNDILLCLEDYEALVDLSLALKDENMFKEYSKIVRFIRDVQKEVSR